ncbi:Coenzyme F420 hydrogenase/dehydrogenase, beta subunit C-terminal domain [Sphingobacterium haloxyli]|uniref:Coenzyme F420 hydrogenase n=1 Tax=Sphingobacterium haloxyli TaxID=2100533 RepID=A0A2S9J290_9SPHI|nr:Coenzyme F420 hydrogenase/dehydrogenase, beta subunit C-terminal domain [Sphingobacterium haloxyli]PRD46854.1 coenzyme F420 hydrogenase [Sphingobacterium haloxyli]
MYKSNEAQQLLDTVINGGYCIGCGACAVVDGSPFEMKLDEYGLYKPVLNQNKVVDPNVKLLSVCPFSDRSLDENEIGNIIYPDNIHNAHVGNYIKCFAGYVNEGGFREKGSSGGLGKWLGYTLLKEGLIDCFIQLAPNTENTSEKALFEYKVYTKCSDVIQGSKSSYYPSTLVEVLSYVEQNEGRYAITGVPCFIKTLRLMSQDSAVLKERITFTIGIVCGGMKSANQAKMIGWQLGVHPDHLKAIDFRRKHKDRPANFKIYQVWSTRDDVDRFKDDREIIGTDYGAGFFKPKACDFCDDVVGETADISIGDAWLPDYVNDPKGNCITVIRNKVLLDLVIRHTNMMNLALTEVSAEDVIQSQQGGFRHRREGLSYRMQKKVRENKWLPKKRVQPGEFKLDVQRKKIYDFREKISEKSHILFLEALKTNNLAVFTMEIEVLMQKYRRLNRGSITQRIERKVLKILKSLF